MDALDLKQCTMRETGHINGGRAFFGYIFQCNQHPRLSRIDRCDRATKQTTIRYQVDGVDVADLDDAAAKLSLPPAVTDEMRADLATIGSEFGDHRKTIGYDRLKALECRGLIEWGDRGKCRVRA